MRFKFFGVLFVTLCAVFASDALAQSGMRGSSSRGGGARRMPSGIPSRIGGARSKTIPMQGGQSGIMNSARSAYSGGGGRSAGSGYRPSSGGLSRSGSMSKSRPSASRSLTGTGRPPRTSSIGTTSTAANTESALSSTGGRTQPTTTAGGSSFNFPSPSSRTWTDSSGKYSVQGTLAAHRGEWVWLRRSDGLIAKLRLQQLSAADQAFVRSNPTGS